MSTLVKESAGSVVGRAREFDAICAALSKLQTGSGQVLFLAGEAGIGKSTLARVAAAEAEGQQLPVFWGFSWESGGAPAYWAWTQVLRRLITQFAPDAEIVNKLGQILSDSANGGGPQLQPEQARFLLLEAVRALLETVGRQSPVVLIFEDLHAADSDSLQLLHYVARHLRALPVLLIGTFREAEARTSQETEALWRSVRDAQILHLGRLSEADIRNYLESAGKGDTDDELVRVLLNTTAGNPLFLTELTEMLRRQESLDARTMRLPKTVQQVIGQQLDLLPESTRAALSTASIFGRRFSLSGLAKLSGAEEKSLAAELQAAIESEFIHPLAGADFEFTHVLHRDVLYRSLPQSDREELHRTRAEFLRQSMEDQGLDRWAELATHLSAAGSECRFAAVSAWREAGNRAQQRLAFEESVRSYRRALDTFGDGPRFSPAQRCELMLEYAGAMLVQGDIEAGQEQCREAFEIARTLAEPQLMAEAALTYGSVIVVAKVDKELVAALKESLECLPHDDAAMRARVAARLAAAQQPAPDPSKPMEMAREAIELARTTGDETVVYDVLKSAIGALMDFAPVDERVPLNREVESLAARYQDVPGQFRSNLRLMIDASELGDRQMMDEIIDAAEQIANRIGLPHYQWRVASARAMQATIEGRFEQACLLLDEAEDLAEAAEDISAGVTIPVQRFVILCDWDSPVATPIEVIEEKLSSAFALLPAAEFYARPIFASYAHRTGQTETGVSITDEQLVERLFTGGDRFCLLRLGEVAVNAGDRDLASRVFDLLEPYRESCATMGLMGTHWAGPVSQGLAVLAMALGRHDEAATYFDEALEIARCMRAQPSVARIYDGMAALAECRGDDDGASRFAKKAAEINERLGLRPLRAAPEKIEAHAKAGFAMSLEGEVWNVRFDTESALIRNTKGLQMLGELIARPDTEIHVLDLSGAGASGSADPGDAGPILDDKARQEYRGRVRDLQEELEEATELGDQGRVDELRGEIDFITHELSRAFGLGGRRRQAGNPAERARVNVRRRVKDAIRRIEKALPAAGRYLKNTIKTGTYCRYTPM